MNAGGSVVDKTPVDSAFAVLSADLDVLVTAVESGGLDYFDDPELLEFMQRFEKFRNRLSLVDHRAIGDAERRRLAAHFTHSTLSSLLVSGLRISPAEASRRTRAAAAVGERISQLGEVLEPVRPLLAAAQREGGVSPEQVSIVERALDEIDRPGIDPADVAAAEETLVGNATTFGPRDLRKLAVHLVDVTQPDGTVPDDELAADRRDLHLSQLDDGSFRCEGRLTSSLGALLKTVCNPLAKPRHTTVTGPNGGTVEVPDPRTHGQRMHDALEEALSRLLNFGDKPATGGTPTTLIVTINYEDLLNRTGHGESSDGTLISASEVLRLADEADILPAVLTRSGALLELGRTRRIASHTQTLALIARDGGCSFPGCSHPPEYCDRHHLTQWINGGVTDINNLTLICRYHHTRFAQHGWTCALNAEGIIEWTPPRWVDHAQKPQVNHRIRRRILQQARNIATDEEHGLSDQAPLVTKTEVLVLTSVLHSPIENAPRVCIRHGDARAPEERKRLSHSAMETWFSSLPELAPV